NRTLHPFPTRRSSDLPTYPSPDGPLPGCGSILAAVATAAGVQPEVAGKPYDAMVELVRGRVGDSGGVMAGDRPSTDGLLARRLRSEEHTSELQSPYEL